MIAVESTGILAPELFEEEGTLLRLLGEHMTTIVRGSEDPAVEGARTSLVAVDQESLRSGTHSVTVRFVKKPMVTRL